MSGCNPTGTFGPIVAPTAEPTPFNGMPLLSANDTSTDTTTTKIYLNADFNIPSGNNQVTSATTISAYDRQGGLVGTATANINGYPTGWGTGATVTFPYNPCALSRVTLAMTQNIPAYYESSGAYYPAESVSQTETLTYPAPTPSPSPLLWILGGSCSATQGGCPIYQSTNNGASYTNVPGDAVDISADGAGHVWLVNTAGNIYSYASGVLTQMPGSASDVAVDHSVVWVLSPTCNSANGGCQIWESTNGGQNYTQVSGAAVDVAADGSGNAWLINATGNIYEYNPTTGAVMHVNALRAHTKHRGIVPIGGRVHADGYTQAPGSGSDIAALGSTVWVLGNVCNSAGDCPIYRSINSGQNWTQVAGSAKDISIDQSGNAWIVNSAGYIYHYSPSAGGFAQVGGSGSDVAAGGTQ